ncbi:hypothetical protein JR064_21565 [Xanthomonas sp. CFBP 8703]|uniref:Uncharacterized protein n=1 Tax=Xanthomonas bonasiae TaxID=2810351 RepID=A0ABS3B964_9XANT|nr:hypothetical protein [Xanthomonas bonasiae]MBN6104756.1 hypothetical protein [Xanthomonas bonasiae]
MKASTISLVVVASAVSAIVGGVVGGSYALSRTEASAAAWHWLDASAMLANANGSPKNAEQQRDSLNANFVAQTRLLASTLGEVKDDALHARVIERAKSLSAHPDAIAETSLTLEQRKEALTALSCLAGAADGESLQRCAKG